MLWIKIWFDVSPVYHSFRRRSLDQLCTTSDPIAQVGWRSNPHSSQWYTSSFRSTAPSHASHITWLFGPAVDSFMRTSSCSSWMGCKIVLAYFAQRACRSKSQPEVLHLYVHCEPPKISRHPSHMALRPRLYGGCKTNRCGCVKDIISLVILAHSGWRSKSVHRVQW